MIARLRSGAAVGGWILKANPALWDVLGALEAREALDSWRLAPSYRVSLLKFGQPVSLWLSKASGFHHTSGIWATGHISGEPYLDCGDPEDPRWSDPTAAVQLRPFVPVNLRVHERVLPAETLRADPRFAVAEIFRCPRMGSPLALSVEEQAVVEEYVASDLTARRSP